MANLYKNRLTFIKRISKYPNPKGLYKCECGNVKEIMIGNVKCGHTKSCGCLKPTVKPSNTTHGLNRHPLFKVWMNIKGRCYNKNNQDYYLYGGRGVTMCDKWLKDFKEFYDWCIKNGWQKGLKVDKDIKSKGVPIYSPETCSVITNKENCNHTRTCHFIEYNGERKNIKQWSVVFGVSRWTLFYRLKVVDFDMVRYFQNSHKWKGKYRSIPH